MTRSVSHNLLFLTGVLLLCVPTITDALAQPNGSARTNHQANNQRVFVSTPSKDVSRLVSDCMTPRSRMKVLHPEATSDEAIALLLNNGFSGCPVVHPINGHLMGIISSSDFIFKDYAGALLNMEANTSAENLSGVVSMAQKIVGSTVEELMTRQVVKIRADEPMSHAADTMARGNLHRLIVVNPEDNDELVGILTRSDVMKDVMTTVQQALPEKGTYDIAIKDDDDDDDLGGVRP